MKYLIANWKAEMTLDSVKTWINACTKLLLSDKLFTEALEKKTLQIVICPSFPHIPYVQWSLSKFPQIAVGAQTVSSMKEGKFTGEVTAKALKDFVTYAIIGHSERRINNRESVVDTSQKLENCKENGLKPIFCVRNENDYSNSASEIVAYEPVDAIGTGKNAPVSQVIEMKKRLNLDDKTNFLYGGSVDELSIISYLKNNEINGFLVGTASLHASTFYTMAKQML